MNYFEQAQTNCLHSQLFPLHVPAAPVIQALRDVPREEFVPQAFAHSAYVDECIPLGYGRHLMETTVFARLVDAAAIQPDDVVLDVGCGTGYSAAVLSMLAAHVLAIEEHRELASKTRQCLQKVTANARGKAEVLTSSLSVGCTLMSPYNVIILEGGVEQIPTTFFERLANGGRLVTIEMLPNASNAVIGMGRAVLYRKSEQGTMSRQELFDTSVARLPGFEKRTGFVF